MDERPIVYHDAYCHHEAGHAVTFWHYGIGIVYVRMKTSNPIHFGLTETVDHDVDTLTQIETEMQCVAAGKIAERLRYMFPEELPDDELIKCFSRYEKEAAEDSKHETAEDSNQDEDQAVSDGLRFARLGRDRDAKILEAQSDADTGPATWLPIFRDAQRLVEDELRAAIKAVAYELTRNPDDLYNEDIARLATEALKRIEP